MNRHWIDRLSEYHDGELSPEERAACDVHLASCDSCRTVLEDIRAVASRAANDPDRDLDVDLWPGILQRIEDATSGQPGSAKLAVGPWASEGGAWHQRRIIIGIPQLALAASLLIAVSAGTAYLASNRWSLGDPPPEPVVQAVAEPMMAPSVGVLPATFADAQFDQAVADLEQILRAQRDQLDPQTVMVIERNLKAIDEAINEARTALDADPANTFLNSHLAASRRRKLDLLREAATISSVAGD